MSEVLLLAAIVLTASSGLAGLLAPRSSTAGQRLSALIAVAGCLVGLIGLGVFWSTGASRPVVAP